MAAENGWLFSEQAKRDFEDMRKLLGGFRVTGACTFRRTRDTMTLHIPGPPTPRPSTPEEPATVDVYQGGTSASTGTVVATATPFLNMSTSRATSNVMEFFAETVNGTAGAALRLKSGSTRAVLQLNSGNWVIDYVRMHS